MGWPWRKRSDSEDSEPVQRYNADGTTQSTSPSSMSRPRSPAQQQQQARDGHTHSPARSVSPARRPKDAEQARLKVLGPVIVAIVSAVVYLSGVACLSSLQWIENALGERGIKLSNFSNGYSASDLQQMAAKASSQGVRSAAQILTGGAAFVLTLSVSQLIQGGVFRIAASTPFGIPHMLGAATVAGASVLAVHIGEASSNLIDGADISDIGSRLGTRLTHPSTSDAGIGAFGVAVYKSLGGALSGVAPSLIDNLGALSRLKASLPATLLYATSEERAAINTFGEIFGCHTCGRTSGVRYNADHMPPLKYVKLANARMWRRLTGLKMTQRFYPQCKPCSDIQAQMVRSDTRFIKYHLGNLHPHYATGLILVGGVLLLREYNREKPRLKWRL